MDQFSSSGKPTTIFESQLLAEAMISTTECIHDVWVQIGRRIGIDHLAVVLDELGGQKASVPTRSEFFSTLARPLRNRAIRDMRNKTGASLREIAEAFSVSHDTVKRALVVRRRD